MEQPYLKLIEETLKDGKTRISYYVFDSGSPRPTFEQALQIVSRPAVIEEEDDSNPTAQ
jgi:hypothetical protein